jgi:hypothetical protein
MAEDASKVKLPVGVKRHHGKFRASFNYRRGGQRGHNLAREVKCGVYEDPADAGKARDKLALSKSSVTIYRYI